MATHHSAQFLSGYRFIFGSEQNLLVMNRIYIFINTLLTLSSLSLVGQEINPTNNEIRLSVGISDMTILDRRLSASAKSYKAPVFGLTAIRTSQEFRHQFNFKYALKTKGANEGLLNFTFHRPEFYYSLQKKSGDIWIGGHINFNTLLTFPSTSTGLFGNSPISYTIASGIGPSISYGTGSLFGQEKLSFQSDLNVSLLSYVIRPEQGHPYPAEFLEPGVFTPTRAGMAGSLLRSGTIKTIDKYQSIRINFGIFYAVSSSFRVGMNARVDYNNDINLKSSKYSSVDYMVSASYLY